MRVQAYVPRTLKRLVLDACNEMKPVISRRGTVKITCAAFILNGDTVSIEEHMMGQIDRDLELAIRELTKSAGDNTNQSRKHLTNQAMCRLDGYRRAYAFTNGNLGLSLPERGVIIVNFPLLEIGVLSPLARPPQSALDRRLSQMYRATICHELVHWDLAECECYI